MSLFRGFIAIDIKAVPKLIEFEKDITKTGVNVKLVEPENVHITLKFLGDTEEALIDDIEQIMKDAVKKSKPFTIQLKGAGVFPNQKYIKIVWIGIKQGEQIGAIAQAIDEHLSTLGFAKEKRAFSSHLTIARVRSARNKQELLQVLEKYNDVLFAEIMVDMITLKKSELTQKGPIYTTLREVNIS